MRLTRRQAHLVESYVHHIPEGHMPLWLAKLPGKPAVLRLRNGIYICELTGEAWMIHANFDETFRIRGTGLYFGADGEATHGTARMLAAMIAAGGYYTVIEEDAAGRITLAVEVRKGTVLRLSPTVLAMNCARHGDNAALLSYVVLEECKQAARVG